MLNKPEAYSRLDNTSALLVFWRHAQTALNAKRSLQGSISDVPLDETGISQAKEVGKYILERYQPDEVITSPLLRTRQTLEAGGFSNLPTKVEPRFMEMDYGELEGKSVLESAREMIQDWSKDPTKKMPKGESLQELFDRVSAACEEIISQDIAGKTLLICTHATPIKAALAWTLGTDSKAILKMHLNLASISVVGKTQYGTVVLVSNETPI